MTTVKLIGITQPVGIEGINTAEELVAYAARVSNPGNQLNTQTAPKLLKYLMANLHWSPFEMVHCVFDIQTTRAIAHQIVRHRSFAFQEFSQRYANVNEMGFTLSECRMQDAKNRQNSLETNDRELAALWMEKQQEVIRLSKEVYNWAISNGLAKEVSRNVLPEGLTNSRVYMSGTLRSVLHYISVRYDRATQKEHREVATGVRSEMMYHFPSIAELYNEATT